MWWAPLVLAGAAFAGFLVWRKDETVLASGMLIPVIAADCTGRTELVAAGPRRLLRLSGVSGCGDHELQVLLLASTNARDSETVESTVRVLAGVLPPHTSKVVLLFPPSADPSRYRAVTLWDPHSHSNLSTATLRLASHRAPPSH